MAQVSRLRPDYMGFIFHEQSPRNALSLVSFRLPEQICPVGVFVNKSDDYILHHCRRFGITTVQLHGTEPPEQCLRLKQMGFNVFKAIAVSDAGDLDHASRYAYCADMLVLDSKSLQHGGSGISFDISLLHGFSPSVPYMIGGGVDLDYALRLIRNPLPMMAGIDLNSKFELSPGIKDVSKLQKLYEQIDKIIRI